MSQFPVSVAPNDTLADLCLEPDAIGVAQDTEMPACIDVEAAALRSALDALAAELSARGWTSRVRRLPGRLPGLRVVNPEPGASALSEDIYARPDQGGGWVYWWPWAEPIADDPAGAAAVIVRVLRSAAPVRLSARSAHDRLRRGESAERPDDPPAPARR